MARTALIDSARSLSIVLISIILSPVSFSIVLVALLTEWCRLSTRIILRRTNAYERTASGKRNVLVTGVGMAKGLTLARAFYLDGHHVVGADFENYGIPCSGRFSRSLATFCTLRKPEAHDSGAEYTRQLLQIIKDHGIDLWVSCSGVANALDDAKAKEFIEQHAPCKCIQLGVQQTAILHEKDSFMSQCKKLDLPVPITHNVTSPEETLSILSESQSCHPERKFILKPVGVDDVNRGNMTLLPLQSKLDTKEHVTWLPMSQAQPWILQEFIPGGEEYCTHALIVKGEVKCFVACPSAELLMHYRALPRDSPLSRAMLAFTREYVLRSSDPASFNGHLSFDFMVKDSVADEKGIERTIYAIECNPRAHTAVVLFLHHASASSLVKAYLSLLDVREEGPGSTIGRNGLQEAAIVHPQQPRSRYWVGHDLFSLVIDPTWRCLFGRHSLDELFSSYGEFLMHLFFWKEGTFEIWDPLPAFALYHIYWPLTIISAWRHGVRWSRLNVSTTKMFVC